MKVGGGGGVGPVKTAKKMVGKGSESRYIESEVVCGVNVAGVVFAAVIQW